MAAAFEPVGLAVLMPLGIAGLVLSIRGLPVRRGWVPGLCFGVAFSFTVMVWMRAVGTDAWLAMCAVEAAFFVPYGSVIAWLVNRRAWPVWVAVWWVAIETWRGGWPLSGMPFGRLAYATADTPWAEALPWIGMAGVSFLVALTGTSLAWLVVSIRQRPRSVVLVAAALITATVVPSWLRVDLQPEGTAVVAAVQGDVPGSGTDVVAVHREVTANHVASTIQLGDDVRAGSMPQPDFVLWPENSTAVDPFRDDEVRTGIEAAASAVGVPVLVGGMADHDRDDTQVLNQGIVWDPVTGGGDRYTKRHPVPYGEYVPFRGSLLPDDYGQLRRIGRDMARGTRLTPLNIGGIQVADAICFDVAYDDGIAAQVGRGGQFLVVQTSNAMFVETGQIDQQFEITRLRALETGRWVAVAAINGVSGVIAPDGTVVASAGARTQAVLVEEVELSSALTPAVALGLWPGRFSVLVALVHLAVGFVAYRRRRGATGPRGTLEGRT